MIGDLRPIAFDTRQRFEDTPYENFAQFWCTTGNTIPYCLDRENLGHRHSSRIIQTGISLSGQWKISAQSRWRVRVLMFHSAKPPTNEFVINKWLNGHKFDDSESEAYPVGVEARVYPCVEGTGSNETVYLPYTNWYSRHMWQNNERRQELFKVTPSTDDGRPVRVLYERKYNISNNSNREKQKWMNIFVKMHHRYAWMGKYGPGHVRSDGNWDTSVCGEGSPSNTLYVLVMAMCVVPSPRMGDPVVTQDNYAGIEEWPMARKVASHAKGKGKEKECEGSVPPVMQSKQVAFATVEPGSIATRQMSTAEGSASHFRKGTRRLYKGDTLEDTVMKNKSYGDNTKYQDSWEPLSNRARPTVTRVFQEADPSAPVREGSISTGYVGPMPTFSDQEWEATTSRMPTWSNVPTPIIIPSNPVPGPSRFAGAMSSTPQPSAPGATRTLRPLAGRRPGVGGRGGVPFGEETSNDPLRLRGGASGSEEGDADEVYQEPEGQAIHVEPAAEKAVVEVVPDDAYRSDPLYNGPKFARLEFHSKLRIFFKDGKDYFRV